MNQQTLLKPTGPYTIGISRFDLHDENRLEINHPNGRLIPIQIYFPMEMGAHIPHPKVFEDRAPQTFPPLETMVYSALADLNQLNFAPSDGNQSNGSQSDLGQLPIILLNHGHDVSMTDYACIAEDLASHGYVVISIQHQLETDTHPPAFWIERSISKYAIVIDNMLYVFEWLKQNNKTLFNRQLCLAKVGLIGHSMGGNALQFFASRSASSFKKKQRITLLPHDVSDDANTAETKIQECVVVLDAGGFSYPSTNQFPMLFLLSAEREAFQKESGMYDEMIRIGHNVTYYKGSKHISFMDHGYINPQNPVNSDKPYFNGPRPEIDAFWEKLRGDIREFLEKNGVRWG